MITNNKAYLDRFSAAAGISLASTVAIILLADYLPLSGDNGLLSVLLFNLFTRGSIFIGLGLMLRNMTAGFSSAGLVMVSSMLTYFLNQNWQTAGTGMQVLIYFAGILLMMIPHLLFVLLTGGGWKRHKSVLMLGGLLIIQITLESQSAGNVLYFFFDATEDNLRIRLLRSLIVLLNSCTIMLAVAELVNYVKDENFIRNIRLLNLANNPSSGGSTLAFWVLKSVIIFYCAALAVFAKNLPTYLFSTWTAGYRGYLCSYVLGALLGSIPLILGIAWYLRKLMFEHLLIHDLPKRAWLWLLSLPFIGFIGWLISLLSGRRQTGISERRATLEEYASSPLTTILVITGICYLIAFLSNINEHGVSGAIVILLSAALYFLFTRYQAGFYILFWLQVLTGIVGLVMLLKETDSFEGISRLDEGSLLVMLGAMGLVYTTLQLPVYHPTMFEYVPVQEEEEKSEGGDLFADYKIN